jgi:protein gp37
MGNYTNISWADKTFNAWIGCTKVSPACDNCYAEKSMPAKFQGVTWGAGQPRRLTSEANWKQPLRWNAECAKRGVRERVFCASLADVFDNEVPVWWRIDLLSLIRKTPNLDWLLLTKRIGNAHFMLKEAARNLVGGPPKRWNAEAWPNVWLGATICNQEEADRDIPKLLATPAAKRFLSIEPMLGPIDLRLLRPAPLWSGDGPEAMCISSDRIDLNWVICGGESGKNARPMHPNWPRGLRDQCEAAGVPFHFKQWGEWFPDQLRAGGDLGGDMRRGIVEHVCADRENDGHFRRGDVYMRRVGKKTAGRLLDGREWDEVPA